MVCEANSVVAALADDERLLTSVLREVTVLCSVDSVLCTEVIVFCSEFNWSLIVDN